MFAILLGLLAVLSVAYTLPTEKQNDDKEVRSIMEDLLRGVVVQMQEDENQQSSAELQTAMRDLLAQTQEGDEDGGDLLALLQDESNDDGAREEEEDDGDILALLQGEDDGDDGVIQDDDDGLIQDEDEGGDAKLQGFFSRIFRGIRRFGGRVNKVCNKVRKYTRYAKCLPGLQAELQKADEGDDELAKDLLKRIANVQEDGDGDAEAQFFKSLFRRVRKVWGRGRRFFKKIRRGVGRIYRGYKKIRRCIGRRG